VEGSDSGPIEDILEDPTWKGVIVAQFKISWKIGRGRE
jgi:hypothetical protein